MFVIQAEWTWFKGDKTTLCKQEDKPLGYPDFFLIYSLPAQSSCGDSPPLWCLLWIVDVPLMIQRAAAVRRAAAPHPPSPQICLLCLNTLSPHYLPSAMALIPSNMEPSLHLRLLPHCHLHLRGCPLLLLPQCQLPPTPTEGKSAAFGASSGSRSLRRRYVGNPTSGRWQDDSSSTRSMSALWRSCSGNKRRRRWGSDRWHQPLEPLLVWPGLDRSKRAARKRWVSVMTCTWWWGSSEWFFFSLLYVSMYI